MGLFYKQGRSVKQDFDSAAKYFKLSADQGWPEGQLHLGMLYFQGNGRPRSSFFAFFSQFLLKSSIFLEITNKRSNYLV